MCLRACKQLAALTLLWISRLPRNDDSTTTLRQERAEMMKQLASIYLLLYHIRVSDYSGAWIRIVSTLESKIQLKLYKTRLASSKRRIRPKAIGK